MPCKFFLLKTDRNRKDKKIYGLPLHFKIEVSFMFQFPSVPQNAVFTPPSARNPSWLHSKWQVVPLVGSDLHGEG